MGILWSMFLLPFNYLDNQLTYWVKRIFYIIYGIELPHFMVKLQEDQGIVQETIKYDTDWH